MGTKPNLNSALDPETYADHYWLKSDMIAYCRTHGLATYGTKTQLSAQILSHLSGDDAPAIPVKPAKGKMPSKFDRETRIGSGWRCSQELRKFFECELGSRFHFDGFMRAQIKNGEDNTLRHVMHLWRKNQKSKKPKVIESQFEYNRFVRAYRAKSDGVRHSEVVAAWKTYRDTPVSRRKSIEFYIQPSAS